MCGVHFGRQDLKGDIHLYATHINRSGGFDRDVAFVVHANFQLRSGWDGLAVNAATGKESEDNC